MKRITAYLLALILCGVVFAGCEANGEATYVAATRDRIYGDYVVVHHGSRSSDDRKENRQPAILNSTKKVRDFYRKNKSVFITGYDSRCEPHYNETLISEEYNDSFFQSRNLLFIPTTANTISSVDSIQDIYLSGNVLNVEILRVTPNGPYLAMAAYRYFIISLDKSLYSNKINIEMIHEFY